METTFQTFHNRMDNFPLLQCIRSGLIMMIPILLIGSFTLVLRSLPIAPYQSFIATFLSGALYQIFTFIHNATFGFLAVYMTMAISVCYAQQYQPSRSLIYGPLFASIVCFCIFSGLSSEHFTIDSLGVNGMFTAIVCSLGASFLYCGISKRLPLFAGLYTDGADGEFNSAIMTILPTLIVITIFALVNLIFVKHFHVGGFQALVVGGVNQIFSDMGRSLGTALLFVFLSSIMWFFGIHGSDVLDPVSQHIFEPALNLNLAQIQAGGKATEIFCKPFFDVFVFMGGCGTTACLMLAVLLFSKRRSNHSLARFAALPMLFNINEIMVFGLPIVFNPVLLVPFLLTPLILTLVSWFAVTAGLVPFPISNVEWTTPILLGGYLATGSLSGAALQLFNIVVGILIYKPFIQILDERKLKNAQHQMDVLTETFRNCESECRPVELLSLRGPLGVASKTLAEDIYFRLQHQPRTLFYQPQFNQDRSCIGAEALLRWQHPLYGAIYPPMVIQLADEAGQLSRLEKEIFRSVVKDMERLLEILGENASICVNVSGITVQTEDFELFLSQLCRENPDSCRHLVIEITEQAALHINDLLINRLQRIHDMGYSLAIDDFSMGSTSIKYLQSSIFDLIKLDGSLSRDIMNNSRSLDIIASISKLSKTFGIEILAEYVETEKQQKLLEEAGCFLYQGYLYSPAVPIDQLKGALR